MKLRQQISGGFRSNQGASTAFPWNDSYHAGRVIP
jgi:hypothetical protein